MVGEVSGVERGSLAVCAHVWLQTVMHGLRSAVSQHENSTGQLVKILIFRHNLMGAPDLDSVHTENSTVQISTGHPYGQILCP